ncbi:MAG: helix-turn-helix transcriptional regulator [Clostridia bacterium]|nr:helix-turn-helix transcriptional regulator [Clostridia bacterium]
MKFTEVLKDLMIENNIDIKELADKTNIKLGSLYFYFKHDSTPDVECAIKISEYFNCSINYLLGLSENNNLKIHPSNKTFIENYLYLLKINKTNNYKVCNILNINRNSIYNWKKGKTPKMINLIELAKYFDVSVDFLLGRTDEF